MVNSVNQPLLVICPDAWDYRELCRTVITDSLPVVFFEGNVPSSLRNFEPLGFVDEIVDRVGSMNIGGVFSAEDYPGSILAALVAQRLHLPGTPPEVVLLCQHKYLSRLKQQECVPQCVPPFCLVRSRSTCSRQLVYPFFVKPVKSMFQLYADVVRNDRELRVLQRRANEHLASFSRPLSKLLRAAGVKLGAGYMLAEKLVSGRPFTVEGYVFGGCVTTIGIVDAEYYRGTRSYKLFRYPSRLPSHVQREVLEIVNALMTYIGYQHGCFNIDCIFDTKSSKIWLLEINTRMAAQLADLFEKVDGTNTYSMATSLARGVRPIHGRQPGEYNIAASVVFRKFADALVVHLNQPDSVLSEFPDARVHVYYRPGQRLSDDNFQDLRSWVYAIVNIGAKDEGELAKRIRVVERVLGAKFVAHNNKD